MKHTLFILALITASIQTFAQSPRIKLNQITKDSVTGSVLISSPTDSGIVYSRDLFISYGADTVLILGGDTLAATSSIISSVLSDGVTITGDGTTGSELTVDTNTVIATKQDLDLYYLDSNPDGYTSNTGTVTSVGGTGTVNGISLSGSVTSSGNLTLGGTLSGVDLTSQVTGTLPVANGGTGSDTLNFVDLTSAQTVGGAKTFTSALTQSGGDVNFDSGTLFVDEDENRVGIGTTSPQNKLDIVGGNGDQLNLDNNGENFTQINMSKSGSAVSSFGADHRSGFEGIVFANQSSATNYRKISFRANGGTDDLVITNTGSTAVGIGTTSPSHPLEMGSGAHVTTGGVWTDASDIKLKTNINYIYPYGLSEVLNLKPVVFDYINGEKNSLGFIAQDVYEFIPEAISSTLDKYGNETMGLKMVSITATLTKAIQEQQAIIQSIQTKLDAKSFIIESQSTEIETLKTLITELSNRLTILENN